MKMQLLAVAVVTGFAQLAAFTKMWLVAHYFGVGPELDGYYLGFVIPTICAGIITGVLQTGLFPAYARVNAHGDEDEKTSFERAVFFALLAFCAVITFLLVLAAPLAIKLIAGDASPQVRNAVAYVFPIAALTIILNCGADYLGYLLAFRGRYAIAAAAPIANALLGAGLLAAWPEGGLLNITLGTVLGSAIQGVICINSAIKRGFRPFGSLPSREHLAELKRMLSLGGWILPGVVFANLTASLPLLLLADYGEGIVSAFGYANRLHQIAIHLLVLAVSPVILVRFSELVARGETGTLRRLLEKASLFSAVIGGTAVIFVWVFGSSLLQLVFGTGRFDANAATQVANHWGWLSIGLAPAILGNVLAKYLQAASKPLMMSALSAVSLLTLLIAAQSLAGLMAEYAVPAATALSSFTAALLAWQIARALLRRV